MSPAILPGRRRVRRSIPTPIRHRLYELAPRQRRWRRVGGIERVGGRYAVITFDDGPDPVGTPGVLTALEAHEARATFFVLGKHVLEEPDLTREIRDRGHELALHGMTHRRHDGLSHDEAHAELGAGLAAIEQVLGDRPRWYRPPYGRSSPTLAVVCRELELELAYWSSWGYDWEPLSAERIANVVNRDLDGGSIVLLHDSARYAERDQANATAAALSTIVARAREQGLELRPLSAAAGDGPPS